MITQGEESPVDEPEPRHVLTPEQRARLRPTVDADALERLLGRLPLETHPLMLLLCDRSATREEVKAVFPNVAPDGPFAVWDVHLQDPALEALWQAVQFGRAT